jgi:hypothetical protein
MQIHSILVADLSVIDVVYSIVYTSVGVMQLHSILVAGLIGALISRYKLCR